MKAIGIMSKNQIPKESHFENLEKNLEKLAESPDESSISHFSFLDKF